MKRQDETGKVQHFYYSHTRHHSIQLTLDRLYTDDAPRVTCAMVLAEIEQSRASVAAVACSEHIKKVLKMQLQQLEQVASIVQKGESVVIQGMVFHPVQECR